MFDVLVRSVASGRLRMISAWLRVGQHLLQNLPSSLIGHLALAVASSRFHLTISVTSSNGALALEIGGTLP